MEIAIWGEFVKLEGQLKWVGDIKKISLRLNYFKAKNREFMTQLIVFQFFNLTTFINIDFLNIILIINIMVASTTSFLEAIIKFSINSILTAFIIILEY